LLILFIFKLSKLQNFMSFIVIEGLDGSGKSTQVKMLREFFESCQIDYRYLHFPIIESPFFGDLIARFLRGDLGSIESVDPYIVALLYAGDRYNAKAQIEDWQNNNLLVLTDRYVYSNIGFQCAKANDPESAATLYRWILDLEYKYFNVPKPDLSIFLDVPMEFVEQKLAEQREDEARGYLLGKADIHEADISFQKRVRDMYLMAVENDASFLKINCISGDGKMLPPETIFHSIVQLINSKHLLK